MPAPRALTATAAGLCALTAALGIAFTAAGPPDWAHAGPLLLAGTASLFAAVALHAAAARGPARAGLYLTLATALPFAAEWAGLRWGWPFGARYAYHPALAPRLPGGVPLFIPPAWAAIAYLPLVLLGGRGARAPGALPAAGRAAAATAMLVATDLYLDPLAVAAGAWRWEGGGAWFGVPAANFAGWGVVGLAIYGGYFALEGALQPSRRGPSPSGDRILVGTAALLAAAAHVALARLVPGGGALALITAPLAALALAWWLAGELRGRRGASPARPSRP